MPSIAEIWRMLWRPTVVNINLNGDASTQVLNLTAKELYQTQDNLQAVVNFLANSIAQLPLKVFIRDGETERRRDRDSIAAKTLWKPNEYQTSFEFVRALMTEYFVFGSAYVWVFPNMDGDYQLLIIPSKWIIDSEDTAYGPNSIRVCPKNNGTAFDIPRSEFVQFKTYSPGNPGGYLSPISALRQTLQEQVEASHFRSELWKSSGRLNAQIIRPKDVAPWDDEARRKFATAFRQAWGRGGSKAGAIPILEDGMEIKPFSTSFKESEWSQSVVLSRESVAAAYSVNPSLIWHSNTQTYASSKDNARALYAECLGPTLQMLQQRINSFLLPMLEANPDTYVEFDLTEKLKGSFEERASILQSATGRPYMTVDEARAEMNLPQLPDGQGAGLVIPLNVEVSGQANPGNDYAYPGTDNQGKKLEPCGCKSCKEADEIKIKGISKKEDDERVTNALVKFFERQARSVIPKIGAGDEDFWNADRWNDELADDLLPILTDIADEHGIEAAEILQWSYNTDITRAYLETAAKKRAQRINEQTRRRLLDDLEHELPDPAHVFEVRENTAETLGRSAATAIASFAVAEATHQAISDGAPRVVGRVVEKEWITGINARPSHAAMNGERVPIDADFSNGQHWPGEDTGDPDESCGCNCSTQVIITGG
ncbi:MAG: phage portal protein [Mogibacterium sp.]|nr:phage portal protein [Mogibacterium sp.]